MKKFIDQYKIKRSVDVNLEDVRKEILKRIESSNSLVINNNPYQNSISVQSKKLEWMMFPMLPIYRAKIKLNKIGDGKSEISINLKGNLLFCFFKYMSLILFIIFAIVWAINLVKPFDEFFNDSILFSFGPLAGFFILNFMNRNHLKTGYEEIKKLISF